MSTKVVLAGNIGVMLLLVAYGALFPARFTAMLEQPDFYVHAKFIHILSVTLFVSNAIIGALWETRSLLHGTPDIIRFTYKTVTWLDAVFTAPLIIIALVSGIMLGTILGGVWTMGWLSVAFSLFILSGAVWIVADIPTQYRVNRLFETVEHGAAALPPKLTRLLWIRMGISALGTLPLLVVFFLMVHKPDVPKIGDWLRPQRAQRK